MARLIASTPRQDGYRMPGEFELHAGTWILWPERADTWRDNADPAQKVFANLAAIISRYEPVSVGVSREQFSNARAMLPAEVRIVELSANDAWVRDTGPAFVVNDRGEVRLVNWGFNAWGGESDGLYAPWDQDELVPVKVSEIETIDRYDAPMVLEGGSFSVDGEGTLITTEECLLHPSRNPDMTREEIEECLGEYLDIDRVIWLQSGDLADDETNGHVDGICQFVRPGEVIMLDVHGGGFSSSHLEEQLRAAKDAQERSLKIYKLWAGWLQPRSGIEATGVQRIAGTIARIIGEPLLEIYANYYVGNGFVVVPQFDSENDAAAISTLSKAFPDREIVGLPGAREILLGGGNVHCVTQQQPAGVT